MKKHFDSDELLEEFGNDHFQTPGKWCKNGDCFGCAFVWTCSPRGHGDTKNDTEREPCGSDWVIRNIHHGWPLRKDEFQRGFR